MPQQYGNLTKKTYYCNRKRPKKSSKRIARDEKLHLYRKIKIIKTDMIEVLFLIIHNLYDIESSPKLLKWEDASFRTGNRGYTLK